MAQADISWMFNGACQTPDGDRFFPERGEEDRDATIRWVKQQCRVCPVRQQCLCYAIEHNEKHGIWGGLTERERGNLVRRRRQAHPSAA